MNHLDEEIIKVQASTRTIFNFMIPVHNFMRMHFNWYYRWHTTPWAKPVHWVVLIVYVLTIIAGMGGLAENNGRKYALASNIPKWTTVYPKPTAENLRDVSQTDDGVIWIAGASGYIAKRISNSQWVQQFINSDETFNSLDFYSIDSGWAVGTNNTIFSYNGISWAQKTTNLESNIELLKVVAISESEIFILSNKKIIRTTNAGIDWTTVYSTISGNLIDLDIYGSTIIAVGYETGNPIIIKSINGGQNWNDLSANLPNLCSGIYSVSLTSEEVIFLVGECEFGVLKSIDSGLSFSAINELGSGGVGGTINAQNNRVVLGRISEYINYSSDGGTNWSDTLILPNPGSEVPIDLELVGSTEIWAIGEFSDLYYSNNNGLDWTLINEGKNYFNDFIPRIFKQNNNLHAFISSSNITGERNFIKSSNYGLSWENELNEYPCQEELLWDEGLNKFVGYLKESSIDNNISYIANHRYLNNEGIDTFGLYYCTENSKLLLSLGTEGQITYFDIIEDNQIIWGTYANGTKLFRGNLSTDPSLWNISENVGTIIRSIKAISDTIALAVGDNGKILRSTNAGLSWELLNSGTTNNLSSITILNSNYAWVAGDSGLILNSNNIDHESADQVIWNEQAEGLTASNLNDIKVISENNNHVIWAVGDNGTALRSQNSGSSWSIFPKIYSNDLTSVIINGFNDAYVTGMGQGIFHFTSQGTATKLLIALPGQSFINGIGVTGVPTPQTAGTAFSVNVYAVDENNEIDPINGSQVGLQIDDPWVDSPDPISLSGGQGVVDITLKKSSSNTHILVGDLNLALNNYITNSLLVYPSSPAKMSLSGSSTSTAGTPTEAITITIQDQFGNTAPVSSDTNIALSTSSSKGYFNTSLGGVFDKTSLVIPSGSNSSFFYYLDSNTGTAVITTSASGFSSATKSITINPGSISTNGSSVSLSATSVNVSDIDNVNYSVILRDNSGNPVPAKNISILSSRQSDVLPGPSSTDSSGNTSGSFHSQKSGISTYAIYDLTDNVYLDIRPQVTFNAIGPSSFTIVGNPDSTIAGTPFTIDTKWTDRFGNIANIGSGSLNITSSDGSADGIGFSSYTNQQASSKKNTITLYTMGRQTLTIKDSNFGFKKEFSINIIPAGFSASESTFTLDSHRVGVGSFTSARIIITDSYSNPLPNRIVTISSDPLVSDILFEPKEVTTNTDGKAVIKITSQNILSTNLLVKNITDNQILDIKQPIQFVPATVIQKILDSIRNNEEIQDIAKNILLPLAQIGAGVAGATLLIQALSAIPQGFHLAAYGTTLMLQAVRIKRRKTPWGRVIDSITGKKVPTAIVRLYNKLNSALVSTAVTDHQGRFEFVANPGQYYVTVTKPGYIFPATFFAKVTVNPSTLPYSDRYLGQTFIITKEDDSANLTIPIDPENPKWTLILRLRVILNSIVQYLEVIISYSAVPLLSIGTALSLLVYIIQPSNRSFIALLIYIVLIIITWVRLYIKINRQSIVYDAETGKPLPDTVISIFDNEFKMLRASFITNSKGQFQVMLNPGEYEIKVDHQNYSFTSNPKLKNKKAPILSNLKIFIKKTTFIHKAIALKRLKVS